MRTISTTDSCRKIVESARLRRQTLQNSGALARDNRGGRAAKGCGIGTDGRKALTGAGWLLTIGRCARRPNAGCIAGAGCGLLAVAWLCGCEDAGRKPVQAKVPALAPVDPPAAQVAKVEELPQRKMVGG